MFFSAKKAKHTQSVNQKENIQNLSSFSLHIVFMQASVVETVNTKNCPASVWSFDWEGVTLHLVGAFATLFPHVCRMPLLWVSFHFRPTWWGFAGVLGVNPRQVYHPHWHITPSLMCHPQHIHTDTPFLQQHDDIESTKPVRERKLIISQSFAENLFYNIL